MHQKTRAWSLTLTACALYVVGCLVYLRPIWKVGGDHLTPIAEDPLFNLAILKWGAHQLRLGLPDLWNPTFFFPTPGALALSDHLIGPAAAIALLQALGVDAVAGYNVLLFLSFAGSAGATFWVFCRAGRSWAAALLAGWMFAFSPFRISHLTHIQILLALWIPFTLWCWDRFLAERTVKTAAWFLCFYLLHLSGGTYLAYMIHAPLAVLFVNRLWGHGRDLLSVRGGRGGRGGRGLAVLAPVVLIMAGAALAVFLPYARQSRELGLARTDEEIRAFGARFASYLSPSPTGLYFGPRAEAALRTALGPRRAELFSRQENALFAGFVPTLLAVLGLADWWRRRREKPPDVWQRGLAWSGAVCCALSFPAFYLPLMRWVPGLDGMRVPARFYVFVSFALVWFAARGLDSLRAGRKGLLIAFAAVLCVELAPAPLRWVPVPPEPDVPPVYRALAERRDVRALVELPLHGDHRETWPMYFWTIHWKPIANGYSGYRPPSHVELDRYIAVLPDGRGFALLRRHGITHLLVHARPKSGRARRLEAWERTWVGTQIEPVYRDRAHSLYRLLGPG
jgi:hypothetical protein